MLYNLAPRNGAFLEYAWDLSWRDPFADDPPSCEEFQQLRVTCVRRADTAVPAVFVTKDRENFQCRYILNHPFDGELTCNARDYISDTRARIREEARTLPARTNWRNDIIQRNITKTVYARYL